MMFLFVSFQVNQSKKNQTPCDIRQSKQICGENNAKFEKGRMEGESKSLRERERKIER